MRNFKFLYLVKPDQNNPDDWSKINLQFYRAQEKNNIQIVTTKGIAQSIELYKFLNDLYGYPDPSGYWWITCGLGEIYQKWSFTFTDPTIATMAALAK